MTDPVIRDATAADFPRIVALNAAEVAHTSAMDVARLTFLHDAACLHRVAVVDGEVAAFLLAFRDGAHYPNPNFDWFAARYPSFVYVDRVVVDARFNGRGVGSRLYRDLFAFARHRRGGRDLRIQRGAAQRGLGSLSCALGLRRSGPAVAGRRPEAGVPAGRQCDGRRMKYDDAEYCFLNFETDRLPNEAGGTHMGMYLAWAASKGLLDWDFDEEVLAPLLAREVTGSQLFFDRCDGKLTDDDFNDVGNAFTASYYEAHFVADYARVFADQIPNGGETTDDFCSVPDTWDNYDRLAPVLDERFAKWRQAQAKPVETGPAVAPSTPAASTAERPPLAIVEDPAEAVEKIRARAEGGEHEAWFELGVEYITGDRVPRDMAKAADAFMRGADRGDVSCQFNLGVCFQHGDGRPQDAAKALHWFSQAANAGHAEGLFQLAQAYRSGNGVPQDLVAANALMLLAQSRGSADARRAGITAGTLLDSTALLGQIREPGQLLLVLARRRSGSGGVPAAAGMPPKPRTASAAPTPTVAAGDAGDGRVGGAAVIALLVGAFGFILLLLAGYLVKGTALQALAVALGAVAAFGAFKCSLGLGKSTGMAALLAVLAFVPVLGSFVCLVLVLQIYRQRDQG